MILIGLTGIIGSGKTFALNFYKKKGYSIFSADEEVKKILKTSIVKKKINKSFPEVFDRNKLNKNKLAQIVFSNKNKLKKIENIIHPIVNKKKNLFIKKNKKKIIILEIPIIFEKKSAKNYDYIILMQINKKKQFERVIKRKNMTLKLLNDINLNQISSKQKKYADFIVNNNNSKQETKKKLQSILNEILVKNNFTTGRVK